MGKVISVVNQKGGVGKTTTAINLGASLGVLEFRTLLIDADPQANATSGLGIDPATVRLGVYECLIQDMEPTECIVDTRFDNLWIMPSNIDLVGAELEMVDLPNRERMMSRMLEKVRNNYDFIIIDCSPSLGIITTNSLTASDSVIIPVQCEFFALEGLSKLLNTIKIVQNQLNPELSFEGILLTMYDSRLRLSNQVVEEVKMHFQDLVFDTIIQRNARVSESPGHGMPVLNYDADSKGAMNYLNLAREILQKNQLTRIPEAEKYLA